MMKNRENRKDGSSDHAGPLEALAAWLESVDFDRMRSVVQALGESKDSAAVEPLADLAKKISTFRHVTIAALKKLAENDEQAAVELSIATQKDKPDSVGGEWGARVLTSSDRRRTPRVLLEIPVLVKWTDNSGSQRESFATTRIVNADGGLLTLRELVSDGTLLELTNTKTKAKAQAKVVWSGLAQSEGEFDVAIELEASGKDFWVGRAPA